MKRSLDSKIKGFPSGTLLGEASITRHTSFGGSSLLYREKGELVTEQGFKLRAERKYIYRYSSEDEKISMWFVKDSQNGDDEVDYLFHELEFETVTFKEGKV